MKDLVTTFYASLGSSTSLRSAQNGNDLKFTRVMPELPEVETIKRGLEQVLPRLQLENVDVLAPAKFHHKYDIGKLDKQKITGVRRRAKVLIIDLDDGNSILFHLKMTGQLIYQDLIRGRTSPGSRGPTSTRHIAGGHPTPPLKTPVPNKSTHVVFSFTNGGQLFFNDLRKFGWIKVFPTPEVGQLDLLKTVGPEPFDEKFTAEQFYKNLQRRKNTAIKTALMDQTVIAGVGNIYSDEALWLAQIHPNKKVKDLTKKEIELLFTSVKTSLDIAIKHRGSSSRSYVDHKGDIGTFLDYANTYHRTGKPCKRCSTPIVRQKIGGRSAHYCPNCQQL